MNINTISPYQKNAKQHPKKQIEQIAASIKEFGFNQPVVVDKNNVIIVGHGRYEAAKILGLTDIPVMQIDLTEDQAKAYRLADNKLNESDWDMELVIEELKLLPDPLFALTGFDKDLILEPDERDDQVPDVPETPKSKLGDIYQLGAHRVMCGDSTKLEDVERLMDGKKADMVFTDPPYNVAYVGGTKDALTICNDSMTVDQFRAFVDAFITNIFSFCNGVVYVCMSSSEWGTVQDSFIRLGGHWSRVIIWVKDRMVLSRADYHTQFEPIAVVNEDVNEEGEPILYGWKKGVRHFFKGGRKQTDVWRIERPLASREHPTMKPVQLCARAITNNTEDTGLILDLFLGSGSTLIAAGKTGRVCYGMELDPKYVDVIVSRYCEYVNNYEVICNGQLITWNK